MIRTVGKHWLIEAAVSERFNDHHTFLRFPSANLLPPLSFSLAAVSQTAFLRSLPPWIISNAYAHALVQRNSLDGFNAGIIHRIRRI